MSVVEHGRSANPVVSALPSEILPRPSIIFTDVDDTLTYDGQLPVETFSALHRLKQAGFEVVPVTGASAGWCDCLIKTWPIQHIIGENGALTMEKDQNGVVSTRFVKSALDTQADLVKLMKLGERVSQQFVDVRFTQDQPFRLTDIAFDIGQAVSVEESVAEEATDWLKRQGVQAKRSSIHINVWIGGYSKASSAVDWLRQRDISEQSCLFVGDSPNDESMFKEFNLSVGVANILRFLPDMDALPTYITNNSGGYGFVDLANVLLDP